MLKLPNWIHAALGNNFRYLNREPKDQWWRGNQLRALIQENLSSVQPAAADELCHLKNVSELISSSTHDEVGADDIQGSSRHQLRYSEAVRGRPAQWNSQMSCLTIEKAHPADPWGSQHLISCYGPRILSTSAKRISVCIFSGAWGGMACLWAKITGSSGLTCFVSLGRIPAPIGISHSENVSNMIKSTPVIIRKTKVEKSHSLC